MHNIFYTVLIIVLTVVPFSIEKSRITIVQTTAKEYTNIPTHSTSDADLLKKIDQLFIIGFRGISYETAPDIKKVLETTNVGGVILFDYDTSSKTYRRNIVSSTGLTMLTEDLKAHAKTPLFISIDEEGGLVSRLKTIPGYIRTPAAQMLGNKTDSAITDVAFQLGSTLKAYGFTMNFAPVLDVNTNPHNPVIGKVYRSFSTDPYSVGKKAMAFSYGLSKAGIIPGGKHYPGHGSSTKDSHKGFVDITATYKTAELIPFAEACRNGLPVLMVGHVIDKNVDIQLPATLSKAHIDRAKTIGCTEAVFVTDDMDMKAITDSFDRSTALTNAFTAGIDMVIISNNITMYDSEAFLKARILVLEAVRDGFIPEHRINEAYEKVTALKRATGLLTY